MSLRDDAIRLYKESKEMSRQDEINESDKFCRESMKELKKLLGGGWIDGCKYDIKVMNKGPGMTVFLVDGVDDSGGVLIRSISWQCDISFEVIQTCERCGDDHIYVVSSVIDIGRALVEGHSQYECDRFIKMKKGEEKEKKKDENGLTIEDKLVKILREFVNEECGNTMSNAE